MKNHNIISFKTKKQQAEERERREVREFERGIIENLIQELSSSHKEVLAHHEKTKAALLPAILGSENPIEREKWIVKINEAFSFADLFERRQRQKQEIIKLITKHSLEILFPAEQKRQNILAQLKRLEITL